MNIVKNFKDYIFDLLSIFVLILSTIFLFNHIYYNPLLEYNKTIKFLSNKYKKDELDFYTQLHKSDIQDISEIQLNTIPKLLTRINNTCKAPGIIIRTLKPHSNNPFSFELQFISNYFDFLQVLSEFEKLNININKIDIKPYEIDQNNAKHIITIDIEAIDGGEQLSLTEVSFLEKELNRKRKRDPFQRFAKVGKTIKRVVDLTWMHKLSGIGKVNGKYVATIDHRIYYKNSKFKNMKVTDISAKSVYMTKNTKNGIVYYILNFRYKTKGTNEK